MKASLSLALALLALAPAQAQIFHPEAGSGAVLGAIAGAVIGNNSGSLNHNPWQGAAIGAGAGLLLGQIAGEARSNDRSLPAPRRSYVYRDREPRVVYSSGYDYDRGYGYDSGYGYGRDTGYGRTDYRGAGLFWGGVLGAVIGHNSGDLRHNGWRGAAYGAGAGLILGSIAEAHRPRVIVTQHAVQVAPAAPAAAPQQVTIINNNYYNTPAPSPMAPANTLFGR